ncbi:MAG: peptide chain release factor N(5)-glutamine methyltransferase [Clostridia bacterium]|nr:peptide chain release factor N(5)-glutamine methyltransferase [Clostridia bacterium]
MTVFEAYNDTKRKLEAAKIEDFVFEAKQIIRHITGFSNAEIIMNANTSLTEFQQNKLIAILKQRAIRYPLQYILGEWGFYGGSYKVGPGVLIPRADTETLIDVALDFLKGRENVTVLDLCTGSGCIAISIAREKKSAEVTAVEKYKEALRYAEENIKINETDNVELVLGDVLEGAASDRKYDLIVSNPPYIPPSEMGITSPEVAFEPETALLGGEDGLDFYRAIAENYKNSLKSGGMLIFEVGINEDVKVKEILEENEFQNIAFKKDADGINRVVFGTV